MELVERKIFLYIILKQKTTRMCFLLFLMITVFQITLSFAPIQQISVTGAGECGKHVARVSCRGRGGEICPGSQMHSTKERKFRGFVSHLYLHPFILFFII